MLSIPVAFVTFVVVVFLSLLLTPVFNMARMATNSDTIGYITFAFSPLLVLFPAVVYLRSALRDAPPYPTIAIGFVVGTLAALLFNLPGGIWMFLDFD